MCKTMCKGGKCTAACVGSWLVLVGALNWGLIGLGQLFGNSDWNVVHMIFGSVSWLESVVYLLVGVSAVVSIVGCKCATCKGGAGACGTGGCGESCGCGKPTENKPM